MKSKDRLLKILAVLAAVVIVIYFAAEMYSIANKTFTTQTVYEQTVLETVDAKMYIIRDETPLTTTASGVTVPLAKNGERVSKGSTIAAVFPSEASAENYVKATALEQKLETYKKIDGQLKLANIDINKLNSEINNKFISLLDAAYENDYSSVGDDKLSFAEKLSRKQISLGKEVDCAAQIAELENEVSVLRSSSTPTEILAAEEAGYFVSELDGYENHLTSADIESLTRDKLEEAFKAKKSEKPDGTVGKIIDGYNWYIATVVDTAKVSELSKGSSVNLIFGDSDNRKVSTYIHHVKAFDSNESLVVFRCNLMNDGLTDLRIVEGKIVVNEYTGLKVNRDAVRLDDEGNSGVYVRRGNIVNFRSVNIIYSEDSFIIASKPAADSGIELDYTHLKLYDEVVLSGKELKDGMVIR